jgi:aminoglycoside phosphotransferase (APT) family kinase protein
VSRLSHGYSNLTRRLPDGRVEKRYEGLGRSERADREYACLVTLANRVPVAEVVERDPAVPLLIVRDASGTHGQEMIDAGRAAQVLRLLGSILVSLHQVPPGAMPSLVGTGPVIVHGDFGPQNVLIEDDRINALVDWEFAHIGQPVEDLAWAEWIVRMHHPDAVDALPELLDASRLGIDWSARHRAMVARCEELMRISEASGSADTLDLWRDRLRRTEQWNE